MSGRSTDAGRVWLEALVHFRRNPYFLVWTRYNLATEALNKNDPASERHLLQALELTRNPKAKGLRATVWNGLGKFRSQLGEWNRAEFAFLEARKSEPDRYDKQISYQQLIRVQYLSGRLGVALETLQAALHDPDLEHPALHIAQAKVYLKLGQTAHAKAALEKAGKPQYELEEWPYRVAQAELARAEGRPQEALGLLEGLPLHTLHSREEARQFPELFGLLREAGREVPEPLEYVGQLMVQIQALGALEVSVNGRAVPLAPTGRAGELLVLLLAHHHQASNEKLAELLWPGSTATQKRQALWQLVNELRHTLGWAEVVQSLRGAYRLDPTVEWRYDVEEAKAQGRVRGSFLEGVYSDWALEVDQELEQYRA